MPISSGSQPAVAKPLKMPSGSTLRRSASAESITRQAEAPSESWLALPAVIHLPSPRTGSRPASPSIVVVGRLQVSRSMTTSFSDTSPVSRSVTSMVVSKGTISSSKAPDCCPAAQRSWLCSEYSSWLSRVTP